MRDFVREEKLFRAIGGVPEGLVEEAMEPRVPRRPRPSPIRLAAMAAAFTLVAGVGIYQILPRMGGANAGGNGIREPGSATFMSYAGPALPRISNFTDFAPLEEHPQIGPL